MQLLLALTLLGVAAGKEETCPIIKWLEEHGKDAFETVMECKDVPAALKRAAESDCRSKPTPRDRVAMVVWSAITAMQHMNGTFPDIVKHSKIAEKIQDFATAQLIASTHKSIGNFCGHPECNYLAKTVSSAIAPCYGSLICSSMTKLVPFAACRDAFQTYLETTTNAQLDSVCDSEEAVGPSPRPSGDGFFQKHYCSEINADLMYKDFECFIEYKSGGARGCTPKCLSRWQGMNLRFPGCTQAFARQTQFIYEAMRTMWRTWPSLPRMPTSRMPLSTCPRPLQPTATSV